jgi:hypothetical protein
MAMLPSPAKLPTGSHLLILLLLIAGVIVPTRQALALSACYADALGTWRGPVLNGSGVEDMITTFSLGADGRLVGAVTLPPLWGREWTVPWRDGAVLTRWREPS